MGYLIFSFFAIAYILFNFFNTLYNSWKKFNKLDAHNRKTARMTFKQWKDLYALNPNRYNNFIDYSRIDFQLYFCEEPRGGWIHHTDILITFSFWDYIKFLRFVQEQRNNKNKNIGTQYDMDNNRAIKHIIEVAQMDIEKLRIEAQNEIDKASKALKESAENGAISKGIINAIEDELKSETQERNWTDCKYNYEKKRMSGNGYTVESYYKW